MRRTLTGEKIFILCSSATSSKVVYLYYSNQSYGFQKWDRYDNSQPQLAQPAFLPIFSITVNSQHSLPGIYATLPFWKTSERGSQLASQLPNF
jgi:hypothetical protein